jgi:hypothetical protein
MRDFGEIALVELTVRYRILAIDSHSGANSLRILLG